MSAVFVVQGYRSGKKGALLADNPMQAQTASQARRMAERLAQHKALVAAFIREGDPKTGDYEDPKLIVAFGEVPEEIRDMPKA